VIDPMFDSQTPELTSDLEWMLQSGQATSDMLAEALVQEYYPAALRLALVIVGDPAAARSILLDAFSNALLNLYRYRSQTGARAWFFHILQRELRKNVSLFQNKASREMRGKPDFAGGQEDSLPLKASEFEILEVYADLAFNQRLAVFYRVVAGWPIDEIALAMGSDKNHVNEWLNQASRRINEHAKRPADPRTENQVDVFELLKRSIDARWPEEQLDEGDRATIVSRVLNRKAKRSSLQRRAVSVKEIFLTTLGILIVAGVIWGANQILPDNGYSQSPTETSQSRPASSFRRSSRFRPTPTPLPHLRSAMPTPTSQGMIYELKPGERLSSVAARFGISINALREFNRLPADANLSAGDRIVLPPKSMQSYPTPTPVTPLPKIEPPSTPNSYLDIVSALSRKNYTWQTLWMDAKMIDYGPPGFVGPPQVSRNQLWLSQAQFLDLVGNSNGIPDVVFLRNQENLYAAQPGIGQIWFNKMQSPSSIGMLEDRLSGLFDDIFFRPQDKQAVLRVVGGDVIAGRNAWRVDQTDVDGNLQSRFWMDTRTGFILRNQTFGGSDHKTLLSEVRVMKIFFDVTFPNQSMFDPTLPWRGGYASDYTGKPESDNVSGPTLEPALGHEPMQYIPAFGGFDPGLHSLTFQYPPGYNPDKGATQVDIFSGMYYLGHTFFGNPRTLICSRSNDGNQIAYVSRPSREPGPGAQVHVIDLQHGLKQVTPNLPGVMAVSQFAFSTNGRELAFFGYDSQFDPGGLYLMDLDTGKTNQLATLKEARSLVWSPDNVSLGFIGLPDLHVQDEVMVMNVSDAKITYSQPFSGSNDRGGTSDSDSWPMKYWGVKFPISMGGLGDCVNPSNK
jgi:DNA-directed RNA polymerase specialized sigma24 family protein/LysM repeat protein